jgi:dipeptidyl aminopeptidase/acylaminoacyl peptidase
VRVVPLFRTPRLALALIASQACARPAPKPERADARLATSADPPGAVAANAADRSAPPAAGTLAASTEATPSATRAIGPFEAPFAPGRTVYFGVPPRAAGPRRLIANLHGMCNPPAYACGHWLRAGTERGFVVCPTGNASCGPGAYNAPTWTTGAPQMAADLERAVAAVDAAYPGEISPEGAVLTGFSKGGYAAPAIAARHPGRFAYLLINEADVALDVASLRKAGVRAVALVAGEIGSQVAGERRTAARLQAQGFPAKLWIMPKAGHHYSADIDAIMADALDWLVAHDAPSETRDAPRADRPDGPPP